MLGSSVSTGTSPSPAISASPDTAASRLGAAAGRTTSPWPGVVAFLEAFLRYAQGKRTFLTELREAFDKHPEFRLQSKERIDDAMDRIVRRAQEAGAIRTDVNGAE